MCQHKNNTARPCVNTRALVMLLSFCVLPCGQGQVIHISRELLKLAGFVHFQLNSMCLLVMLFVWLVGDDADALTV
jgi:hypothetical protein